MSVGVSGSDLYRMVAPPGTGGPIHIQAHLPSGLWFIRCDQCQTAFPLGKDPFPTSGTGHRCPGEWIPYP